MSCNELTIPPGPTEPYRGTEDLLHWINEHFQCYGDVYKASIYGSDVYVISNPQYCEYILRTNWQNYERKGQVVKRITLLLGNGLIGSNGEFWKHQRRMMQPAFSRNSIKELVKIFVAVNAELLQAWKQAASQGQTVNVTQDTSRLVLKITLMSIFSHNYPKVAPYFNLLADDPTRDFKFANTFRSLGRMIVEIARERRRKGDPSDDILGKVMQSRDRDGGRPMADAQLAREIMTLVVAGHETTAGLLNWLWYLLARQPECQVNLSNEFERMPWGELSDINLLARYTYTQSVIDEALRLYPPLWLMTRRAVKDDHLGPFIVPAGTEIYISPYLIQRSPHLWEAPEDFDPGRMYLSEGIGRHELALCPFGAGPRNCIGETFARIEIQIHLMMFARELGMYYNQEKIPEMTTGMNLLSKEDFIMRPSLNRD